MQSDCNSGAGGDTLSGTSFTLSPLACTRRACLAGSIEGPYLQLLSSASSATIIPGWMLKVEGPDGARVADRLSARRRREWSLS